MNLTWLGWRLFGSLHIIKNENIGFYLTIWIFNKRLHYCSLKSGSFESGWPDVTDKNGKPN